MSLIIEQIRKKIKASRSAVQQKRSFFTKIHYRLKICTAWTLGSIFAFLYFKFFFSNNKFIYSIRVLLKRRFWKIYCKYFDKYEGGGLYVVKNQEDKIFYLLSSNEKRISEEIFATGDYDKRYFDQALKLFPFDSFKNKKIIFFDVGANQGTFTLLALKSGYFKKTIAIEPHLKTFKQLRINLLINNFDLDNDSIRLFNVAIDPFLKRIEFEINDYTSGDNRVRLSNPVNQINLYSENDRKTETVSCEKLQKIFEEVSIGMGDILCWFWIDVQGAEVRVLESLDNEVIQKSVFVLEVWEYGLKRLGNSIEQLALLLEKHQALILNFDHPNYRFEIIDAKDMTNYLGNTGVESYDIMFVPKSLIT
jgi:FkbM family methyltransferase